MTDTSASTPPTGAEPAAGSRQRRGSGLSGMLLPELKQMAGGLGIKGAGAMRKSQLVDAIKAAQSGSQSSGQSGSQSGSQASAPARDSGPSHYDEPDEPPMRGGAGEEGEVPF